MTWNAQQYLRFHDERTRPSVDLVSQIQLSQTPQLVVDLGCGPGNSTQVLQDKWPAARIVGIDHSPEMLAAARRDYPEGTWLEADANHWTPESPVDLLFSNAALQWLPHHQRLIPFLFQHVAKGGAFAFQIPSSTFATVRSLIHEISQQPVWDARLAEAREQLTEWRCKTCGVEAFSHDGRPPKECKKVLKGPGL